MRGSPWDGTSKVDASGGDRHEERPAPAAGRRGGEFRGEPAGVAPEGWTGHIFWSEYYRPARPRVVLTPWRDRRRHPKTPQ